MCRLIVFVKQSQGPRRRCPKATCLGVLDEGRRQWQPCGHTEAAPEQKGTFCGLETPQRRRTGQGGRAGRCLHQGAPAGQGGHAAQGQENFLLETCGSLTFPHPRWSPANLQGVISGGLLEPTLPLNAPPAIYFRQLHTGCSNTGGKHVSGREQPRYGLLWAPGLWQNFQHLLTIRTGLR